VSAHGSNNGSGSLIGSVKTLSFTITQSNAPPNPAPVPAPQPSPAAPTASSSCPIPKVSQPVSFSKNRRDILISMYMTFPPRFFAVGGKLGRL
jgi:hypothetical protein